MKNAHDLVMAAKQLTQEITVDQAQSAVDACDVLIDVREGDEFAAEHLKGAVHMSRGMLEFKLSNMPQYQSRDLKIVLYCKTSGRAALCSAALHEMGYTHVQSIAGGIDAWKAAGKPVVTPITPSFE
jgi:rhodanese-related sulfurtransferase